MGIRLFIVLFVGSVFISNATAQTTLKLSDFTELIGIKKGEKIANVKAKYGSPSSTSKLGNTGFDYYDNNSGDHMMSFSYDVQSGIVNGINLHSVSLIGNVDNGFYDYIKLKKINDPRLATLKMKPEELIQLFGQPVSSEYSTYEYDTNELTLSFYCYDVYKGVCRELSLFWKNY